MAISKLQQWQDWRASKESRRSAVDVERALYEAVTAMMQGTHDCFDLAAEALALYESKGKL